MKLQVSMRERTKVDVSLDHFGGGSGRPGLASVNLFQSSLSMSRGLTEDLSSEKQSLMDKAASAQ